MRLLVLLALCSVLLSGASAMWTPDTQPQPVTEGKRSEDDVDVSPDVPVMDDSLQIHPVIQVQIPARALEESEEEVSEELVTSPLKPKRFVRVRARIRVRIRLGKKSLA